MVISVLLQKMEKNKTSDKEKTKIVNAVKSLLNIDQIIVHLDELDFEKNGIVV